MGVSFEWSEGYDAYWLDRIDVRYCPYTDNTQAAVDWKHGWREAWIDANEK